MQAHLQLVGDERYVEPRLEGRDLRGAHVGHPEGANEALPVEGHQRPRGLVRVRERVGAVQQQYVDHVRAQPRQALFDAPDDARAAQVVPAGAVLPAEADAALGLKGDPLAQAGCAREHFAEHGLGLAVAVDVGVVEGGDAAVEGRFDSGLRHVDVIRSVRVRFPAPAEAHAAVQHPLARGVPARAVVCVQVVRHAPTLWGVLP
ncbi:hypothetical protein GCM10020254_07590 [Streptomyces goshikiensis]